MKKLTNLLLLFALFASLCCSTTAGAQEVETKAKPQKTVRLETGKTKNAQASKTAKATDKAKPNSRVETNAQTKSTAKGKAKLKTTKLKTNKQNNTKPKSKNRKTTKSSATKKPTARIQSKAVSEVLPRLQRSNIEGAAKAAAKDVVKANASPKVKLGKTSATKLNATQPKSILKKPTLAKQGTTTKPSTSASGKTKLKSKLTARQPVNPAKKVTFNKQVEVNKIPNSSSKKLGGSKTAKLNNPVVSNKSIASQATSKRPNSLRGQKPSLPGSKLSSTTKKTSAALKGAKKLSVGKVATAGLIAGGVSSMKDAKQLKDSGKITKKQYQKAQLTNATKVGGEVLKLKKLNPTAMLLKDTIGTDPISLGVEGIGDLINGTDNAKQSLKGMKSAWNGSLTKQTFTDPKGAAKRVGNDLKKTGNDIKNFSQKAGKTIGKETKKVTKSVSKGVDKAKNAVGKAGKNAGKFFKGVFKKKKKK